MDNTVSAARRPFWTRKRKNLLFVCGLLVIPITQFIVFWVYVNFDSILLGFQSPSDSSFTWANFERFVREFKTQPYLKESIVNTLIYFVVCNGINLPIIVLFSYLLFKKCYGHSVFRVIFFLPSIISVVVMCMLFRYLVGVTPNGPGPIISLLQALHIPLSEEVLNNGLFGSEKTAYATIMVEVLWSGIGINLVLISGALARVPADIFEAGKIDGCGMCTEFFRIVCPLVWPTITTVFILGMAGMFNMYMPVMLMTEGEFGTSTIGWYITRYTMSATNGTDNFNYPAAVGLVFTVIGTPLVLIVKALLDKVSDAVEY